MIRLLTIRPAQMIVLREAFLMDWLASQLVRLYPSECERLGGGGVAQFVTAGVGRAKSYGFTGDEFLAYLGLEMCFGDHFAEDETWARRELANRAGTPADRMYRLRRAAIFHLGAIAEAEQRQAALDREQELESMEAPRG